MPLTDIGNGIKIIDASNAIPKGVDTGEQLKSQLGLLDLVNKVRQAPIDNKIKEIDLALKGNQVLQLDVENEKAEVDLRAKKNDEFRAQGNFVRDQIKGMPDIFRQNFNLGKRVLQQSFPGSDAEENTDGTVTVLMQGKAFTIDPRKQADPEKLAGMEKDFRKEWVDSTKDFKVQSTYFNNLKKLSNLGTAQADIGIVFSYMKMLDPGSTVREGEQATAQNSPGVTERVRNMYNRALTENAPLFGAVGSSTRANFIASADVLYGSSKQNALDSGKSFYEISKRSNLNPRNILTPQGDIRFEDFESADGEQAEQPTSEAPAGKVAPVTPKTTAPKRSLDDILNQNLFGPSKGK